jgi:hypothetical protein
MRCYYQCCAAVFIVGISNYQSHCTHLIFTINMFQLYNSITPMFLLYNNITFIVILLKVVKGHAADFLKHKVGVLIPNLVHGVASKRLYLGVDVFSVILLGL